MPTALELLDELKRSNDAVFALAREMAISNAARGQDDDEWTRLPAPKAKCQLSRWSRSTILRHIEAKHIRGKRITGGRFYSLKDTREYLANARDEAALAAC